MNYTTSRPRQLPEACRQPEPRAGRVEPSRPPPGPAERPGGRRRHERADRRRSPVIMLTTRATGLRIGFVAPGSNTHTSRWANAMCDRGHDVLLISREPALPVAADLFDPYLEMGLFRHLPKIRVLIAERLILRRLEAFSPDIVHFHWLNATLGDLRLARRVRPLVVSVWGSDVIW